MKESGKKIVGANLSVRVKAKPRKLRAVAAALTPETGAGSRCKVKLTIAPKGDALSIHFESKDLSSLRAGLNTNLRLLSASLKAVDAI